MEAYSLSTVHRGYDWLGHAPSYTEITVLHPGYRADDPAWNRQHQAWPITGYVTSVGGLVGFVREYAGERLVCYGLNPRSSILTKPNGRLRSATEADMMAAQNLVLDVDLEGTITAERLRVLRAFLGKADEYFTGLGLHRPVRAATGRGSHLLFAYPAVAVGDCPDLRERLRSFREAFHQVHREDPRVWRLALIAHRIFGVSCECTEPASPALASWNRDPGQLGRWHCRRADAPAGGETDANGAVLGMIGTWRRSPKRLRPRRLGL